MKLTITTLTLLLTAVSAMPAAEDENLDKRQCGTVNGPCDINNYNGCKSYLRLLQLNLSREQKRANSANREHPFQWPGNLPQRPGRGLSMRRHLRQRHWLMLCQWLFRVGWCLPGWQVCWVQLLLLRDWRTEERRERVWWKNVVPSEPVKEVGTVRHQVLAFRSLGGR